MGTINTLYEDFKYRRGGRRSLINTATTNSSITPIHKNFLLLRTGFVLFIALLPASVSASILDLASGLTPNEEHYQLKLLGKFVFFDEGLSSPQVMSCATCHDPATGGTGPDSLVNQTQVAITGANPLTIGNLKPPTNAYATFIPSLHECNIGGVQVGGGGGPGPGGGTQYCGGNFWNGRSVGHGGVSLPGSTHVIDESILGDYTEYASYLGPTADQALNPFANDVEQNIPDGNDNGLPAAQAVCKHVMRSTYSILYRLAWGENIKCNTANVVISFQRIAVAVAAYQASGDINSFSSKRDLALQAELACLEGSPYAIPAVCNHPDYVNSPGKFPLVGFTEQENLGHDLFYNTRLPFGPPAPAPFPDLPVTQCSFCHISDTDSTDGTGLQELYADHAYHNIGIPQNPELPAPPQRLLGEHADDVTADGGVKTPTLRNVDKRPYEGFVKGYGHNGWFKSLESIVHFYNTRNVKPVCPNNDDGTPYTESQALANECWPAAEWPATAVAPFLVGNLGMTPEQEAAVVAYLKTLSDLYTAKQPRNAEITLAILKSRLEAR